MVFTYYFTVVRVHDGDTCEGVLDLGLGVSLGREPRPLIGIRFYGINAPELSTDDGKTCLAYLETLVKPGDVLKVDSYSWDEYKLRIDAIPYLADGTSLCQKMLEFGHGTTTYPTK